MNTAQGKVQECTQAPMNHLMSSPDFVHYNSAQDNDL